MILQNIEKIYKKCLLEEDGGDPLDPIYKESKFILSDGALAIIVSMVNSSKHKSQNAQS